MNIIAKTTPVRCFYQGKLKIDRALWMISLLWLLLLLLGGQVAVGYQNIAAQSLRTEGVVLDQAGAPVAAAEVTLLDGSSVVARTTTGSDGRFAFTNPTLNGARLVIERTGFARSERALKVGEDKQLGLEIVLAPAALTEQVTVSATRTETRLGDTAASVAVLSSEDLATTGALALDDVLRQVPGFSLFRRTSSRVANPTAQGVSLRGVGASGASRAVVLVDGLPLNDPFGGWVNWGRVPRASLDRVEVLRGGGSELYGSAALGGVINVFTERPTTRTLSLEASYGNQQTPDASLFVSDRIGQWGASLAAETFATDGYILVDKAERGAVDTPAASRRTDFDLTIDRQVLDNGRIFLRGSSFGESRRNGTPLQTNRTHFRQLSTGGDMLFEDIGSFTVRAYFGTQIFDQNFSAIAANRSSEQLTRVQRVPSQFYGILGQWSRAIGNRQVLIAGLETTEIRGASGEQVYVAGRASSLIGAGGRQRFIGGYIEDVVTITPRLILTAGARLDRFSNYAALSTTRSLSNFNSSIVVNFPERTETAFNPRLSMLYKVTDALSFTASGYRAFRAPTLNELYREFRVGNVLTLANDSLQAERLTGGEAGANFNLFNRLTARGTFFWSEVTRPIANVTLRVAPNLITRQRQNLGRTRSRGIEVDAETRVTDRFFLSGGYQLADASVLRFPANTALEGLRIPQVPRHQFTVQARYAKPSLAILSVQTRFGGVQFDDDQNRLPLNRFFVVDALASRRVIGGVDVFAAAENLFNRRYEVGRTPTVTLGSPRLIRIGFKLRFDGR